jgi:hypothetical protein
MKKIKRLKLNSNGFGHHILLPVIVIAVISLVGYRVMTASHAATGVAPAGTYTTVYMPKATYSNITHDLKINSVPNLGSTDYFWSRQFYFQAGPTGQGGYVGLQGINRAIFSIFDYDSPEYSSACTGYASGFDGGTEPGTSCYINYTVVQGHTYHLKVADVSKDSKGINWQASVEDLTTGKTTTIATVNVASSWGQLSSASIVWTEYFGPPLTSCSSLPLSNVTFSKFAGNNNTYTSPTSHTDTIAQNSCTYLSNIIDNSSSSFTHEMGI